MCQSFIQGTVIRVFSVPDGQKLFEFRRGVKRYALRFLIYANFHIVTHMLSCSYFSLR